jgi:hypothetical protein
MAKMGRPSKDDKPTIKKLLGCWRTAWSATDGTAPYGMAIERALMADRISIYDIKISLGMILAKKPEDCDKDELALVEFADKVRYIREQALAERVVSNVAGQIFMLKSQFGYRDQAVDLHVKPIEMVTEFGTD